MKHKILLCACLLILPGCITYWSKPGMNIQQTAQDLNECRLEASRANTGGRPAFTAQEMEGPCMLAKGYNLSYTPPQQ